MKSSCLPLLLLLLLALNFELLTLNFSDRVSGFKKGKIFRFPGINVVWLIG